jgi:hypothetical protein
MLVPAPSLVIAVRDKLYMEHVKPVSSPVHLGEKTATTIPDTKHPMVNLHAVWGRSTCR